MSKNYFFKENKLINIYLIMKNLNKLFCIKKAIKKTNS